MDVTETEIGAVAARILQPMLQQQKANAERLGHQAHSAGRKNLPEQDQGYHSLTGIIEDQRFL